ncbi:VOC family protein [Tritonibacter scottomollicae]|uniref:Lactoylglutathione lyase n=1 Tax=Tritonibacter scottomollicae TaxID=483013 RepID=A0A2T1AEE0_TRISK|nr:VOC family protein [Tritonibacter scottomollicae]PRZ46907.1 lactoylglutathione lyase [Tritonibacter scottomollicae]
MDFTQAGIILFTPHYEACIVFYGEVLGLTLLHSIDRPGETLSTFDLEGSYLMIEPEEAAGPRESGLPLKLRFNVADVVARCEELRRRGVKVTLHHYSWGTTAEFHDPAGTRCALRSDAGFGL